MNDRSNSLGAEEQYFSHIRNGSFSLQTCDACKLTVFPPKEACPACLEPSLVWTPQSGDGTVYSCTTVQVTEKGKDPHNVSLINLDVGIRMMSTVTNPAPGDVRIGMRVRARIEESANNPRVVFDAVDGDAK